MCASASLHYLIWLSSHPIDRVPRRLMHFLALTAWELEGSYVVIYDEKAA